MVDAASDQPVPVVEEVMVQETADLMSQPVSINNVKFSESSSIFIQCRTLF